MANYQHQYHAGNFADVFKHSILCLLLEKLLEKPKPFCVIDTHAGRGYYDLKSNAAKKTEEANTGIQRLMQSPPDSKTLQNYYAMIKDYNTHSQSGLPIIHYPGSPLIIAASLRPEDRLLACEQHPETYQALSVATRPQRNIKCFNSDAYQWLNAQLPPLEKRGLILIDPPYEQANEFRQIIRCLKKCYSKFSHGIYAIWYPIKTRYPVKQFHNALRTIECDNILIAELCLHALNEPNRLNGCGMAFLNPPWQLDEKLRQCLPLLHQSLGHRNFGGTDIFKLK